MKALYGNSKLKLRNPPGLDTTRNVTNPNSLLQTYQNQNESGNNLSQIKTDLKDKIQSTRERFIQLKQRKRQTQSSGQDSLFQMYSSRRSSRNGQDSNQKRSNDQFKSFQNTVNTHDNSKTSHKDNNREDSIGSDNVDRDEEFPMTGGTMTQFNLNRKSFYRTGSSTGVSRSVTRLSKEIPSYKLDGAKLIVNRLQAQLKKMFTSVLDAMSDVQNLSTERRQQQLSDKWKFVRNVMSNMDKKKKQPLKDKTNTYNNLRGDNTAKHPPLQHANSDSFQQIQQMFENFRQLRASSGEGLSKLLENQENKTPTSLLSAQNAIRKSSKSRDMPKKRKDLPPQYKQANSIRLEMTKSRDSFDGLYAQTYRESQCFKQQNLDKGVMPQMLLTSRSNLVLDEEHEGLPGLPMESPLNADRLIQRRMYLKQNQQQYENIKNIIGNLINLKERYQIKQGFQSLKRRAVVRAKLNRIVQKKMYEVTIVQGMKIKQAFYKIIKNCVIKSKFENFIEKSIQRLYEKGFDKIKENNWIVEERKEIIEAILNKTKIKECLKVWQRKVKQENAVSMFVGLYDRNHNKELVVHGLKLWKEAIFAHIRQQNRMELLQKLVIKQRMMKPAFKKYKKQIQQRVAKQQQIVPIVKIFQKFHKAQAYSKWQEAVQEAEELKGKQQILDFLLRTQSQIQARRFFAKWKTETQQLPISKIESTSNKTAILNSILIKYDKQQRLLAFNFLKQKVQQSKQVKKTIRLMLLGLKLNHSTTITKAFSQWKHTSDYLLHQQHENEGIVSVSIINMTNKNVCEEILELDEHQEHTVEEVPDSDDEVHLVKLNHSQHSAPDYDFDHKDDSDDQDLSDGTEDVDFDYIVQNDPVEESKFVSQSQSTYINQNLNHITDDDPINYETYQEFDQSIDTRRLSSSFIDPTKQSISNMSELSSQNPLTFKPRRASDGGQQQQNLRYK